MAKRRSDNVTTLHPVGPWVLTCWNCEGTQARLIEDAGDHVVMCAGCDVLWLESWTLQEDHTTG